jgi:hypothetical protein
MPDTQGSLAAARLEVAAAALLAEVDQLPDPLVRWKPAADVWSVLEIVSHVREFVPYWTAQALQVARTPEQPWGRDHRDPDRLSAIARGAAQTLADVTAELRQAVHASAEALRSMSDADLASEAVSRNPRWARQPASFIVDHLVVQHVEKHIGQIRRNVTQFDQRDSPAP